MYESSVETENASRCILVTYSVTIQCVGLLIAATDSWKVIGHDFRPILLLSFHGWGLGTLSELPAYSPRLSLYR